jgi:hypothetical protein
VFRFFSEEWSPWIALLRMREQRPELMFTRSIRRAAGEHRAIYGTGRAGEAEAVPGARGELHADEESHRSGLQRAEWSRG